MVSPNGVLASTAVGLLMQLVTPWHSKAQEFTYLEYDGNKGTVTVSKRVELFKDSVCRHHPADETGDPMFDIRQHLVHQRSTGSSWRDIVMWARSLWAKTA